ncbi:hypothetical protein PS2015_2078 [Pseudohongiella spirulinae]|uniref:Uncharacterized protein n=1 Tax=Pseudohongiella spirulinae TaxID=1249552 RepID=A0A0S2KEH9_9GAMM|nr:hypothetical protein PS2015_2078 [Pseudohongiella spirulinae]
MEDKMVVRNMSIAIGVIALVAIALITVSTIIGNSAGM